MSEVKQTGSGLLSAKGIQKRMESKRPRVPAVVVHGNPAPKESWEIAAINTPFTNAIVEYETLGEKETKETSSEARIGPAGFKINRVKLLDMPGEFSPAGQHKCGGDLMALRGGIGRYVECKKCGYWKAN